MTALEYMEKQLDKHIFNLERETKRGVPEEVLRNIKAKIAYYEAAVDALEEKTADVVEVRHGEWVTDAEDLAWGNALKRKHCSECGGRPHWDNNKREFILAKFCHHCGAKMDGKRKDDDGE